MISSNKKILCGDRQGGQFDWTDGYLPPFAETFNLCLVSFDKWFR